MAIELQWRPAVAASSLHAAHALWRQLPLVDTRLADVLRGPTEQLVMRLTEMGIAPADFFPHALSCGGQPSPDHAALAEVLPSLRGAAATVHEIALLRQSVEALHAEFLREKPHIEQELALRGAPLAEQWEARGLGLMARLGKLTKQSWGPSAEVWLVHPVLGGDGAPYPWRQALHFEAMLANPHARVPEVLRLGWLLAQLPQPQLDRGGTPANRSADLLRLGLLPAIVAAGEYVELCRFDTSTIETALAAWRLPAVDPAALAQWWQSSQAEQRPWSSALDELEPWLPAKP